MSWVLIVALWVAVVLLLGAFIHAGSSDRDPKK